MSNARWLVFFFNLVCPLKYADMSALSKFLKMDMSAYSVKELMEVWMEGPYASYWWSQEPNCWSWNHWDQFVTKWNYRDYLGNSAYYIPSLELNSYMLNDREHNLHNKIKLFVSMVINHGIRALV